MDMAVTVLPQPDSPTSPRVSPRARSKLTPATARTVPALGGKIDREIAHLQQRGGGRPACQVICHGSQ